MTSGKDAQGAVAVDRDDALDALAAARAHEAAGRLAEALADYDRSMRLRPDIDVAEHMVDVRVDAIARASLGAGRETWPPQVADPFPGTDAGGVPEIELGELSTEVLGGAIVHHGCLIVRGLQDERDARAAGVEVLRSIGARDQCLEDVEVSDGKGLYRPYGRGPRAVKVDREMNRSIGGMLLGDAPLVMWATLDLYRRVGLLDAIAGHLGEDVALSFNKSVLRRVRAGDHGWHQDGSFMGADVRTVNVWLALSHCGAGTSAPSLDIVPARVADLLDTQSHGSLYPNSIGQGLIDQRFDGCPPVAPRFAPGDALLFDERLVHRSGSGDAFTDERLAIESWFFAPSHRPADYLALLA